MAYDMQSPPSGLRNFKSQTKNKTSLILTINFENAGAEQNLRRSLRLGPKPEPSQDECWMKFYTFVFLLGSAEELSTWVQGEAAFAPFKLNIVELICGVLKRGSSGCVRSMASSRA